jgi:predicted dienelactone hydrolase
MRRLLVLCTVACLAGCGGGGGGGGGRGGGGGGGAHPKAAVAAAVPHNRCVAAPSGDLAVRGSYAVRRRVLRASRRSVITRARRRIDPIAWFPARREGCRAPLVLVSHGHNGSPAGCERLCGHLASQGFVVVAPLHADRGTPLRLQAPERVDDLTFVLDHLGRFSPVPVDRGAIGVAGHSFGGRTAVELAAQDPRIKAVLTMAGGADRPTTATVTAPTLMLAGGADTVDPPELSLRSGRALPRTTPHRVQVVPGAGHGAFTDRCVAAGTCRVVARAASGWFLRYLGGV